MENGRGVKPSLFCSTENPSEPIPVVHEGFETMHGKGWAGLQRKKSVSVPMGLAVSIDNRQRQCVSQIRLLLLFQWKGVASHQGNVRKTATGWQRCTRPTGSSSLLFSLFRQITSLYKSSTRFKGLLVLGSHFVLPCTKRVWLFSHVAVEIWEYYIEYIWEYEQKEQQQKKPSCSTVKSCWGSALRNEMCNVEN